MEIKEKDFVEIDFNIYANGKLVQTTNEELGKKNNLNIKEYKPKIIIIGENFILKAIDNSILSGKKEATLNLKPKEAYGLRKKELIKTFPESAFREHKVKPVVGLVYDFNGTYGTVKSVVSGRVLVDFNNPLSGKEIKIEYKVIKKIENIKEQIEFTLKEILQFPDNIYKIEIKDKNVQIFLPNEIYSFREQISKTLSQLISNINKYNLKFSELKTMSQKLSKKN